MVYVRSAADSAETGVIGGGAKGAWMLPRSQCCEFELDRGRIRRVRVSFGIAQREDEKYGELPWHGLILRIGGYIGARYSCAHS